MRGGGTGAHFYRDSRDATERMLVSERSEELGYSTVKSGHCMSKSTDAMIMKMITSLH